MNQIFFCYVWCMVFGIGLGRVVKDTERKKERNKERNKGPHYICSHTNAVHISSPDYRKTHLIAQEIGAIKSIIMWCIVYCFFKQLFWLPQQTPRQVSCLNFIVMSFLFPYLKKTRNFFSTVHSSLKHHLLLLQPVYSWKVSKNVSSCYIYFTCGPSRPTECSHICGCIHQI